MLARKALPGRYEAWNRRWGAPFGRTFKKLVPHAWRTTRLGARLCGPFGFQRNNDIRRFEYPWAFEALGVRRGLRVVDIGGSLAGLQFVLDLEGCEVVNVDPGEESRGRGWPVRPETFERLNHAFGTHVVLRNCFVEDAGLEDASFDRAVSISVLEHVPERDLESILAHVRRALKPGGLFVVTLDLFLDVQPFAAAASNRFGHNISARWLVEASGLELVHGERSELYGYPEFDVRAIRERDDLLVGSYPAMVQTLVLRKHA